MEKSHITTFDMLYTHTSSYCVCSQESVACARNSLTKGKPLRAPAIKKSMSFLCHCVFQALSYGMSNVAIFDLSLFILYNFLFVLYNFLCVLYKTPFILYNFLFILYIFLFVLYKFHFVLYNFLFVLYNFSFVLYNFSFVLYNFYSYCIIHCTQIKCIQCK